jgi:hypothetical protein
MKNADSKRKTAEADLSIRDSSLVQETLTQTMQRFMKSDILRDKMISLMKTTMIWISAITSQGMITLKTDRNLVTVVLIVAATTLGLLIMAAGLTRNTRGSARHSKCLARIGI